MYQKTCSLKTWKKFRKAGRNLKKALGNPVKDSCCKATKSFLKVVYVIQSLFLFTKGNIFFLNSSNFALIFVFIILYLRYVC